MRGLLLSLHIGALTGLALYGFLSAIEPDLPPAEDVWRTGWEEVGLDVQLREVRSGDEGGLLLDRLEDLFEEPEFEGTKVRRYNVNVWIRTEVIWLPRPGLLEDVPEGRHMNFKLEEHRGRAHLCRSGRYIVLVSGSIRVPLMGKARTDPKTVESLFDVFEERVEELRRR